MRTQHATECDILVIGSGAAGLAAAVTASSLGFDVIVCDQADKIGGATAVSGGEVWVPMSRQAAASGSDSIDQSKTYLENVAGDYLNRSRIDTYLARAPEALAYLEDNSHLDYELLTGVVDYFSDLPGATAGQRSLGVRPFDGRLLGEHFEEIRAPLAVSMIFGGMALGREDVPHFSKFLRSGESALHVARMLLRNFRDRLAGHSRGTRMVMGNALVGRMVLTLIERDVPIWLDATVSKLSQEDGRVTGATVMRDSTSESVITRKAVVVATGGFSGSKKMQGKYFQHVRDGKTHLSHLPECNDGSGLALIEACGGVLDERVAQPASWTPVSAVPMSDGSEALFPHFGDRAKPGVITVDRDGRRFVNEAINYHDFTQALLTTNAGAEDADCFILTSHRHLRNYGLGRVPPFPGRIGPFIRSGYVTRSKTIGDLALRLQIDPENLESTVRDFDEHAQRGEDPQFGKGETEYQRAAGDSDNKPNPCVAPLGKGPYYAVRVLPGDIGTTLGIKVDERGHILDASNQPINGLRAAGTVASTLMGGFYPGAGANLGPCLVSGYLAIRTLTDDDIECAIEQVDEAELVKHARVAPT